MKLIPPKLSGNEYANLVTAFAIIGAVEFLNNGYDVWDIFIGVIAIILGYSFVSDAKINKDFWYTFFTTSLMSLGAVIIISAVFFILSGYDEPKSQLYELVRFIIFLIIGFFFKKKYIDVKNT